MPARAAGERLVAKKIARTTGKTKTTSLALVKAGTAAASAAARRAEELLARVIGTRVHLVLGNPIRRRLVDVFSDHSIDDAFARTRTVVKLLAIAVEFVSRSDARRLLHGLERFREVVLDLQGVAGVGQGFVDEVFRVFARAHPETVLRPEHMNDEVAFMVRRVGG